MFPFTSSGFSPTTQSQIFKGENSFAGRQNYINQIIKDKLKASSKASIVGPGGKSQISFKAINKYTKEDISLRSTSSWLYKI
jgi:hypothetical protein